jgi:predicted nuclease with TOPRIM domain
MTPLIAEFVPDANFLLQLSGTLGFAGGIVATWISVAGRNKSQKRAVTFETVYATKEELAEMKEGMERQIHELRSSLNELRGEIKSDLKSFVATMDQKNEGVHSRVTELVEKVGQIVGHLRDKL